MEDAKKDDGNGVFVVWGFLIFILSFVMGVMAGCDHGFDNMRREAVTKGVAEWKANEYGYPVFEWKQNK